MLRANVLRVILLAALLVTLVRAVIVHSAHLGPVEWAVVAVVGAALLASLVADLRRAA
jgi:hypothetical protein